MTKLNNYAEAKNTTVPKLINKTFENIFKDKTLTREKNKEIKLPVKRSIR
jgi:hypothetical protein